MAMAIKARTSKVNPEMVRPLEMEMEPEAGALAGMD
jgi:hypothetical protein